MGWWSENVSNNVTFSIFDALSPGAIRVYHRDKSKIRTITHVPDVPGDSLRSTGNKNILEKAYDYWTTTRVYDFLYPEKRFEVDARYDTSDIFIRLFLGENKPELFATMSNPSNGTLNQNNPERVQFINDINNGFYAIYENYYVGYGENATKFNIAALFNPFNFFRTLDNLIINNSLRIIAAAKAEQVSWTKAGGLWALGLFGCTVGALLRLPRVLLQFVVGATVKPLWNCYKYNQLHKQTGEKTSLGAWALAFALTGINAVLIGLTLGLAAPLISYIPGLNGKFLQDIASVTVMDSTFASEAIEPLADVVTDKLGFMDINTPLLDADDEKISLLGATTTAVASAAGANILALGTSKPVLNREIFNESFNSGREEAQKYPQYVKKVTLGT